MSDISAARSGSQLTRFPSTLVAKTPFLIEERSRDSFSTMVFLLIASLLIMSGLPKIAAAAQLKLLLSQSPPFDFQNLPLFIVVALGVWELAVGSLCVAFPRRRFSALLAGATFAVYAMHLIVQMFVA